MSKQSDAKDRQGYNPKPEPKTCTNCRHFEFDTELPVWIQEQNLIAQVRGSPAPYGPECAVFKNLRCAIGGFAVKRMATCKEFERKQCE